MRIIALDFETGGLDPKRHAPVTLGLAVMDGFQVTAEREWLFAPPKDSKGKITREYDTTALEISGQSWRSIKNDGESVFSVLNQVESFVIEHADPCDLVVAFNAPFDFSFWSETVFMAGAWNYAEQRFRPFPSPLVGPWQCVRALAIHRLGIEKLGQWNLDTVAAHFGFSRSGEKHGALEDAILAGKVFASLEAPDKLDCSAGIQDGVSTEVGL